MDGTRVTVVTGGTKGIGLAVARGLARQLGVVLLAHRSDVDQASRVARELSGGPATVVVERCDVADPDQVQALFRRADELGSLGALVNCAGFSEGQVPFDRIDAARWTRVLAANVIGTAMCCREAVVRMKANGLPNRSIVNLSSRAAVLGSPGEYVDYAASKAAVDTLTRGLALEVAAEQIRVNAVRPGIIDTGFHATAGDPGRAERLAASQPMGRVGTADEVARAVLWLLSEDASFTTGTVLDVSGGR